MFRASEALARGVRDYRLLLDRGYPTAASIKLVGDRYRLDRDERLLLFRGVASSEESERRRAVLAASPGSRVLLIDGYNQIFSVMHYRDGRPVFLCTDGFLRDVGASHGHIPHEDRFLAAMDVLADAAAPSRVVAFFDSPVSDSAEHARRFAEVLRSRGVEAASSAEKSADPPLKAAPAGSAIASSDSVIIDAFTADQPDSAADSSGGRRAWDAARAAIEAAFGARGWEDLGAVVSQYS